MDATVPSQDATKNLRTEYSEGYLVTLQKL